MAEDYKLQVSYKIPGDAMINIRANTADELSVLLEGIGDFATQISAVQKLVMGAATTVPLSTSSTTPNTEPPRSSAPPQATPPSAGAGPICQHGQRKFKSGISSKTGNPYSMWVCPMPQGADQCKPVN
jgi:hypothetical protein